MPYQLVVTKGPLSGRVFVVVKTETKIGRDPGNDLVLPDEYVSRLHATIVTRGQEHLVVNASPNGTRVNGKRVDRAALKSGDEITLGAGTTLRYEVHGAAPTRDVAAVEVREEDEKKPETPAGVAAQPFWRRRPKILIAILAYAAVLAAIGVFLARRGKRVTPKDIPYLSRDEIAKDLAEPLVRDRDPLEAKAAINRAMDLYQRRKAPISNMYAALTAFKEAEAYNKSPLATSTHIVAYETVLQELTAIVSDLYFEAKALEFSQRYKKARDWYVRITQYVNDPNSVIHKDVSKRLTKLQPYLEKKRWGE